MTYLFLFALTILIYITIRYNRFKGIVIDTQKKLLFLSYDISNESIYSSNIDVVKFLLSDIDIISKNIPYVNFYVMIVYLLSKSENITPSMESRRELVKEFSENNFYIKYSDKINQIIFNHIVYQHSVEIAAIRGYIFLKSIICKIMKSKSLSSSREYIWNILKKNDPVSVVLSYR